VEIEILDDLIYSAFCHCSECRKISGSAFVSFGTLSSTNLIVLKGEENIQMYDKNSETVECFCQTCGSNLYNFKHTMGYVNIRLGVLDQDPTLRPLAHMNVSSKASWFEITDGKPCFEENAD
jgi:hypothetical protein